MRKQSDKSKFRDSLPCNWTESLKNLSVKKDMLPSSSPESPGKHFQRKGDQRDMTGQH